MRLPKSLDICFSANAVEQLVHFLLTHSQHFPLILEEPQCPLSQCLVVEGKDQQDLLRLVQSIEEVVHKVLIQIRHIVPPHRSNQRASELIKERRVFDLPKEVEFVAKQLIVSSNFWPRSMVPHRVQKAIFLSNE